MSAPPRRRPLSRSSSGSGAYPAARPSAASSAGIEAERAASAGADATLAGTAGPAQVDAPAMLPAVAHLFRCPDCGRHHSEPADAHWLLVVLCVDCADDAAFRVAVASA